MSAATKVELETENQRLQRSLDRATTKVATLDKSLERAKTKITMLGRSVTEGREREQATAEILRVISLSPTDPQPVFDAIAKAALRLLGDVGAVVSRIVGDMLHLAAFTSTDKTGDDFLTSRFPRPLSQVTGGSHRAIRSRTPYCVSDTEKDAGQRDVARARGYRSVIFVPMLRGMTPIGTISVSRRTPGTFGNHEIELLQSFAAQAVIAIENVRLFKELQTRNAELSESLEQQTATANILRVISSSPTDIQPVLEAVAESAARLCEANDVTIQRVDGEVMRVAVHVGPLLTPEPRPVAAKSVITRAVRELRTMHVHDVGDPRHLDEYPDAVSARRRAYRTILVAPLVREDSAIGAIAIRRAEVRPFSDKQVKLLETFAAQAVIAIENVRLFKEVQARNAELTESLEQQTATAEILRVISSSPTDVQPVMRAVAKNAARLCEATDGHVWQREGDRLRIVASHGPMPFSRRELSIGRLSVVGRAASDSRAVHVTDLAEIFHDEFPDSQGMMELGYRTILAMPLIREGESIGVIMIRRTEVRPFSSGQVALLRIFADQAVIAIENVRLFKELQARNTEISEALEQQTATAEILKVISSSPTDTQPVFEAIAQSGVRLFDGAAIAIVLPDGEQIRAAAIAEVDTQRATLWKSRYPIPLTREYIAGTAILERKLVEIPDARNDSGPWKRGLENFLATGYRAMTVMPMVRGESAIGAICVVRSAPGRLSDKQLSLLHTFADQAVIAIENVRLFNEVKARTEELMRAIEEMRALEEVGRAVSSTLDLQTVLVTIITNAVELSKADGGGTIYEFDEATEVFEPRASYGVSDAYIQTLHELRIRLGESAVGICALNRSPCQVPDVDKGEENRVRDTLLREGIRAVLALPLLREERVVGAMVIRRKSPGSFSQVLVTLLQNFASQSVLAIENARLFQQVQTASNELKAASQHKSEFLANMSHELRTPLNAVIGFSEVLQQGMVGALNDKQGEYIEYIHKSGSHLLSLINDILDLSKVEAGRMELDLTDFSVPMAIDNALTLVRERATRLGLALDCTLDPAVGHIHADERKFKQVMLNLLSNAVKFTPEGGRITVAARPVNDAVEVSVTDTGIGIAAEDCDAVFEEFRQVGDSAERKAEGTGLGLALTKKFIELHGGRIWLASTPGNGSTFSFTLPVAQPVQAVA